MFNRNYKLQNILKFLLSYILIFCSSLGITLIFALLLEAVELPSNTAEVPDVLTTETSITTEPVIELIDEPVLFTELDYKIFYNIDLTVGYLKRLSNSATTLTDNIMSGEYTLTATAKMEAEYKRLQEITVKIQADLSKYLLWEDEYYYAAKTYEFLRQKGFSEAVACGIIGNMMIETSGGSLSLIPDIYNPSGKYYGLCQWDLRYYPEAKGLSFEQQLEYLMDTLEWEFTTFGWLYKKNFTYNDFLSITDPAEAAYAFAIVYERCGSISFDMRKQSAKDAYTYFIAN